MSLAKKLNYMIFLIWRMKCSLIFIRQVPSPMSGLGGDFPHSVGIFQGWIKEMVVGPWEREVIIIFTFNFSLMWQSQFLISYHRAWLHFSLQSPITPHFLGGGDKDNALLSPSVEPHVWWVPLGRLDKKEGTELGRIKVTSLSGLTLRVPLRLTGAKRIL